MSLVWFLVELVVVGLMSLVWFGLVWFLVESVVDFFLIIV